MFEQLKKTLDKGLDYANMTSEKIVKAAKELAKENNLTKEEARKLLEYLQKKSEEARQSMEKSVQDFLKASLKKMDIPTKEDIRKLESRIEKLERGVKKAPAVAKKRTAAKKSVRPK